MKKSMNHLKNAELLMLIVFMGLFGFTMVQTFQACAQTQELIYNMVK